MCIIPWILFQSGSNWASWETPDTQSDSLLSPGQVVISESFPRHRLTSPVFPLGRRGASRPSALLLAATRRSGPTLPASHRLAAASCSDPVQKVISETCVFTFVWAELPCWVSPVDGETETDANKTRETRLHLLPADSSLFLFLSLVFKQKELMKQTKRVRCVWGLLCDGKYSNRHFFYPPASFTSCFSGRVHIICVVLFLFFFLNRGHRSGDVTAVMNSDKN